MSKINTKMMEFNKPSELTQVIFIEGNYKKDFSLFNITPIQVDLMNNFYYDIRQRVNNEKIEIGEDGSTVFEFTLKDVCDLLGKYNNSQYGHILEQLDSLSDIKMVINGLGKNKEIDTLTITKFIQEIKISRHKKTEAKKIKITMSNTLINIFLQTDKFFAKMYLKIQLSMVSKYSKLLYELLKDYAGIKNVVFSKDDLIELINVTNNNQKKWMYFNQNILKKSVKEINEKSDIFVTYDPVKEKLEDHRMQVTKIKFNITKQSESRLKELGLIEEPITSLPFYNKSKSKLKKLVKNGYSVVDEDMWIQTDIKKNEKQYESEVSLDSWLKETNQNDKNQIYKCLADSLNACDDPMVVIEDYRIIGLFTKEAFTKNAAETINLMNQVIDSLNE